MMSLMSVLPEILIDCEDTTCIGLVLTSLGDAMRDPVTMISVNGAASVDAAIGWRAGAGTRCGGRYLSAEMLFGSSAGELAIAPPDCPCSETPAPSLSEDVFNGTTVTVFSSR